jgi:hypothetical protein
MGVGHDGEIIGSVAFCEGVMREVYGAWLLLWAHRPVGVRTVQLGGGSQR